MWTVSDEFGIQKEYSQDGIKQYGINDLVIYERFSDDV